jgi:hypothetical protein
VAKRAAEDCTARGEHAGAVEKYKAAMAVAPADKQAMLRESSLLAQAVLRAQAGAGDSSLLRISMVRGQSGFGMQLLDDGTVSAYWGAGGSAESVGVPLGSRIVSVDGTAVAGKQEIISALAGDTDNAVLFELSRPPESTQSGTAKDRGERQHADYPIVNDYVVDY